MHKNKKYPSVRVGFGDCEQANDSRKNGSSILLTPSSKDAVIQEESKDWMEFTTLFPNNPFNIQGFTTDKDRYTEAYLRLEDELELQSIVYHDNIVYILSG